MATVADFHAQLASIMEVLANSAVAEICQLVDDGFASLRLEISRSQRENMFLRSQLRLMEVRSGQQPHQRESAVTCTRKDHHFGEDVQPTLLGITDAQQSQLVVVTEEPVEPEVVIKRERFEKELTAYIVLEHQHATSSSSSSSSTYERDHTLSTEEEIPRLDESGWCDKQDFAVPDSQMETEEVPQPGSLVGYSDPADQSHVAAQRGSGPNRTSDVADLSKDEDKHDVDLTDCPSAESSTGPGLSVTSTGVEGVRGAAEWRGDPVVTVKLEDEPSWSDTFRTPSEPSDDCVSNSRPIDTNSQHVESKPADPDTGSLNSSSFDYLFSSPEVASSLTAHHTHSADGVADLEEPPSSSHLPVPGSGSSLGSLSISDSRAASSLGNASTDSGSRGFVSSTQQALSCQQCGRCFSTSRDLRVHQRSHAGKKIYHCHLCEKAFVHPQQLKPHERMHTGEKPFSCTQCGKRFTQSSHKKRHMSVHTGEKRYSCSLCGKRFTQAYSLKVHQAVHTGERPYSCNECGKSFSLLGNLVRHRSIHVSK